MDLSQAFDHTDAWSDTNDSYEVQRIGYRVRCLWCDFVIERPTRAAAVAAFEAIHEAEVIAATRPPAHRPKESTA